MHTITWKGTIDSAHFIPGHPKCGRLHGHTYHIELTLKGEIEGDGPKYLLDYGLIKERVNALDHKLLLPLLSKRVTVAEGMAGHTCVQWFDNYDNRMNLNPAMVKTLPVEDTSSELLAHYLAELFTDVSNITEVTAVIAETPNTEACWTWQR